MCQVVSDGKELGVQHPALEQYDRQTILEDYYGTGSIGEGDDPSLRFLLSFFLIFITLKVLLGSWAGGILCGLQKELNAPDKFQLLYLSCSPIGSSSHLSRIT